MGILRLSLNLIHYFQDYRQLSKICVKKDVKTIGDLENDIAEVFNIEKHFYLMCKNCYLPSTESIQLLDDNDLIYVIPSFPLDSRVEQSTFTNEKTNKSKNKKKIEETEDTVHQKRRKIKDKNNFSINNEVNELILEMESCTERQKSEKKRKKDKTDSVNIENSDNARKNKKRKKENNTDVPLEVCSNNQIEKNISGKIGICNNVNIEKNEHSNHFCVEETSKKRRRCINPVNENNQESNNKKEENIASKKETLSDAKQKEYCKMTKNSESNNSYGLDDIIDFGNSRSPFKTGNIEKKISENNLEESDVSTNQNGDFVTKRRNRVRSRKKKHTEVTNSENETTSTVFKPPRTVAAPKSHIKFTDDEENVFQDEIDNNSVHSTPKVITNESAAAEGEKLKNVIDNNKVTVENIDISKCFDLPDVPCENSLIVFKKLKMDENYAPIISKLILAEVLEVISNGEQLKLKILDGMSEFKEPMGRFSCIFEEDRNENNLETTDNTTTVIRSDLIVPKLLKL